MRVHFICHGNAYRSRLAEAYFRSLKTGIKVISTGTTADANRSFNDPDTLRFVDKFLEEEGISVELKAHPEQLSPSKLHKGDIVVCVNQIIAEEVLNLVKEQPKRFYVWDIDDFDEPHSDPEIAKMDHARYTKLIFTRIKSNIDSLVKTVS